MADIVEIKTRIKDGEILEFTNDDGDMMELSHKKVLGGGIEFIVMLNCKIVKMTKTFKPFKDKVEFLIATRELELCL